MVRLIAGLCLIAAAASFTGEPYVGQHARKRTTDLRHIAHSKKARFVLSLRSLQCLKMQIFHAIFPFMGLLKQLPFGSARKSMHQLLDKEKI